MADCILPRMDESRAEAPPPVAPSPDQPPSALEDYHRVADTIGMVPSLRLSDNLMQAAVALGLGAVSGLFGWLRWDMLGLIGGAIGGFIVGTIVSGFALMILGWRRQSKRRR